MRIHSHFLAFALAFGVVYLGTQLAPYTQATAGPREESVLDRARSVDLWWLPGEIERQQ